MAGTQDDDGGVRFARGMGCPLGKFTEELKTHVDEQTHAKWLRLCASRDVTSSELLRDVVFLLVHGQTPAELTAQDRRALIAATGLIQAHSAAS